MPIDTVEFIGLIFIGMIIAVPYPTATSDWRGC
jgi:hypothetical protein